MRNMLNRMLWLSVLLGGLLRALTPMPLYWQQVSANGSSVHLKGSNNAVFRIVRDNNGPRTDPDTHGYAYLLSQGIPLTEGWKRIVLQGEWWQEAARESNFEEMVMALYASYPSLLHGKKRDDITLHNYLEVSYDTWNRFMRFREKGKEGMTKSSSVRRMVPLRPVPFKLAIDKTKNGSVQWRFFEKENGQWKLLHKEKISNLFRGSSAKKVYWKIGAWSTWTKPVVSRVHFRNLTYRVLYESAGQQSGNKRSGHILKEGHKQTANDQNDMMNTIGTDCLGHVPAMSTFWPARSYSEGLQEIIANMQYRNWGKDGRVTAWFTDTPIARIVSFYRRNPPEGWKKSIDLLSDEKGGIIVWEHGKYSMQVLIGWEGGHKLVVAGCGRKLR